MCKEQHLVSASCICTSYYVQWNSVPYFEHSKVVRIYVGRSQKGQAKTVSEWMGWRRLPKSYIVGVSFEGRTTKKKRFSLLYIWIWMQVIHFNICEWKTTKCDCEELHVCVCVFETTSSVQIVVIIIIMDVVFVRWLRTQKKKIEWSFSSSHSKLLMHPSFYLNSSQGVVSGCMCVALMH